MSPNPLVFYNATVCPYAHRTWLALEEKKLPYKVIEIDLQNKPQVRVRTQLIDTRPVRREHDCSCQPLAILQHLCHCDRQLLHRQGRDPRTLWTQLQPCS